MHGAAVAACHSLGTKKKCAMCFAKVSATVCQEILEHVPLLISFRFFQEDLAPANQTKKYEYLVCGPCYLCASVANKLP